jgi:dihydrofolate reductase
MHLNPRPLEVVIAESDGIFPAKRDACALDEFKKFHRSMPIVAETEQNLNRRNSPLNSRAQISDGSSGRCSTVGRQNLRYEEETVRDLILKMSMSVDGFVSDMDGRNRWMFGADQEAKAWSVGYLWNASLHIMGSRSFHAMAAWWPTSTDQFAPPMNQIPKAVFSRQGPAVLRNVNTTAALNEARAKAGTSQSAELQPGAGSWAEAYVASGDLAEEIAKLKAQEGKPIIGHGGVSFARSLVAQGLVDQFALLVAPVALGQGLSLFCELAAPTHLKLMSSKAFPGGAVAQIYRAA